VKLFIINLKKGLMNLKCNLCKKDKQLKRSHIIPKFIYRWIKKSSVTGGIRGNNNPNLRKQDGDVEKFLCAECEQKFSVIEKYFKEHFFDEAKNNSIKKSVVTIELFDFCVSLIWRCLKFRVVNDYKLDELTTSEKNIINEFLNKCETYLRDNNLNVLDPFNFHIIPTTENMEEKGKINYNSFVNQRGTDHSYRAFCEDKEGFDYLLFYVKIPFFLIVVEIIPNSKYQWLATKLEIGETVCNESNIEFDNIVIEILDTIHINKEISKEKLSEVQSKKLKERVERELKNNPDKINSGSIKAIKRSSKYDQDKNK